VDHLPDEMATIHLQEDRMRKKDNQADDAALHPYLQQKLQGRSR
jgi:hypothetical protein